MEIYKIAANVVKKPMRSANENWSCVLGIRRDKVSPSRFLVFGSSDVASAPFLEVQYTRINSTKSPASGAGNVSEPRLMSQSWIVRKVVCAYISAVRVVGVPVLVCLRCS
jgi:hypothetical protein